MDSIYEFIMELPLFKGLSKENVSQLLEKTSISFFNFDNEEVILSEGESIKKVRFLIKGKAKIIYKIKNIDLSVEEIIEAGAPIGADRLFGFNTMCPCDVVSFGKSSLMEFSKEQYLNLLNSDRIYLLNFFNYLSFKSQKSTDAVLTFSQPDFKSRLSLLISLLGLQKSSDVKIKGREESLLKFSGFNLRDFHSWIKKYEQEGKIQYSDGEILIPSINEFIS